MTWLPLRVHVLEGDPELEASLVAVLRSAGHQVARGAPVRLDADVVLLGLPAPGGLSPDQLPDVPLVLLAPWLPCGELEGWLQAHRRWSLLPKPVREEALLEAVGAYREGRAPPHRASQV